MNSMKNVVLTLTFYLSVSLWVTGQDPGFFLNDWEEKTIQVTNYTPVSKPSESASAIINIDVSDEITKVSKYLFGNNANTYMTQMVDQPDLINHITNLSPNVIRFPGGNLSNIFFWDMEPDAYYSDLPTELVDGTDGSVDPASYWSGKNTAGWTLSLDNFYQMQEMTGQQGMITVNYSYARYGLSEDPVERAAQYAADWVRYDNGRTKYWEIGNENSGPWQAGWQINTETNQDGQPEIINGGIYGGHFLTFANAMRAAAAETGHEIFIGAQLIQYDAENTWNPPDKDWNELFFAAAGNAADFYIVHSYYTPYNENSTVETILNTPRTETESIMDWMRTTTSRAGVTLKPIALTEWNIFAVGSMQAVSHINGMHATMTLGELIKNKYGEASRWDLANGWSNGDDHGLFNQGDEPGDVPKWNPRPAFYHMYYMQKYFGDRAVTSVTAGNSNIQAYASKFSSGQAAVVIANKGRTDEVVQLAFDNFTPGTRYYWYTLEGGADNGDFSRQVFINDNGPEYIAGGPSNYQDIAARSALTDGGVILTAPALSVTHVIIDEGNGGSNQSPIAMVSASPVSGPIALTVNFSAKGSSDPDGDTLRYMWDFGDGDNATGITASHIYNTAGNFTATLTVFDGINIDQASVDIDATAEGSTCDSPTIASLPLAQDGSGEHCWEVTGTIYNINSWGMQAVFINGQDYTNTYSSELPPKINGKYYIYLNASESWAHVAIDGVDESGTEYYGLATSVNGQGTISLDPPGENYAEGSRVVLTAIAGSGWEFSSWSGDLSGSGNPASITLNSNMNITANFSETSIDNFTLAISTDGNGTVQLTPAGSNYVRGTIVQAEARPNSGYIFSSWSGDISGATNPVSITMDTNKSISAAFEAVSLPVCESPLTISIPFAYDGVGSYCFTTTNDIAYVNSWNMGTVEINGVDFTNTYSDALPAKVDGAYTIYYNGLYTWSHFEANGLKNSGFTENNSTIRIYPNPFTESFKLIIEDVEQVTAIKILDYTGLLINKYDNNLIEPEMNLGKDFSPGIYYVSLIKQSGIETYILTKH